MEKLSDSNVKIFVSHRIDKDSYVLRNEIFYPIRSGAVFDTREQSELPGDDTGDNICEKNKTMCELTTMYWAWKNVEADYYGLCHYRRYMNFTGRKYEEDKWGSVCKSKLNDETVHEMKLDDVEQIKKYIQRYDYIYCDWDVSKAGFKNIYEQFGGAEKQLNVKDLDVTIDVCKEKYPSMSKYIEEYLQGTTFYPCLMFVMKKNIFDDMCKWMFDILFEVEKRIDVSDYTVEEKRIIGHIAERLLGIYITYSTFPA